MHTKKVALLHDWLTGFRGGERVLESLCEMYPDAKIYTLIHKPGSTSPIIESKIIVTSWLNKIPGIHENYRFFLPLMPFAAKSLKIDEDTEIMISSSHCVIKGVTKPFASKHLAFIHSPMRYIYDQFQNYFGDSRLLVKVAAYAMRPYLRTWDFITTNSVDVLIANSTFVQNRILNFYHRESKVIHPFVDLKDFEYLRNSTTSKSDYYIMVTAFAPNKRVDVAIKAFNILGKELRIIGSGSSQETNSLQEMANKNILFLGSLSRKEVIAELSRAKALIFPGIEDFGIVPLESLAAGTPVIAYKAGGVLDTLDEKTAVFFEDLSTEGLISAINKSASMIFDPTILQDKAMSFSKEKFKSEINAQVTELVSNAK